MISPRFGLPPLIPARGLPNGLFQQSPFKRTRRPSRPSPFGDFADTLLKSDMEVSDVKQNSCVGFGEGWGGASPIELTLPVEDNLCYFRMFGFENLMA